MRGATRHFFLSIHNPKIMKQRRREKKGKRREGGLFAYETLLLKMVTASFAVHRHAETKG